MSTSLLFDLDNEPRILKWRRYSDRRPGPPAMKNHTATLFRNNLIVYGGFDGTTNNSRIHVMNLETSEWRMVDHTEGVPPAGRNGHTATLANGKIYYIGGWLGSGPLGSNEVYTLDPIIWTWCRINPSGPGPGPCNMHTADYIERSPDDRCIFLFRGGDGSSYLNDLHLLDVDRHVWRKPIQKGSPPLPRANHSSAVIGKNLFIFGGWDGTSRLQDIFILDSVTMQWSSPMTNGPTPIPRAGSSLTAVGDGLVLFGGSGPHSSCFNDVHMFNPKTMTWSKAEEDSVLVSSSGGVEAGIGSSNNTPGTRGDNPNLHNSMSKSLYRIRGDFPERRAGHSATLIGKRRLLIVGGSFQTDYLTSVYELDLDPPPDLNLVENPPAMKLLGGLGGFFNNEELSDVVFKVEDQRLYGHRIVLCTQSEWFRVLFQGGFQESQVREIPITGVSVAVFKQLLEFMYTGTVDILDGLVEEEIVLTRRTTHSLHNKAGGNHQHHQQHQQQGGEDDHYRGTPIGEHPSPASSSSTAAASGGTQDDSKVQAICELLVVADQYMCLHLRERCEIALTKFVKNTTVKGLLHFAKAHHAHVLVKCCEHFERWGSGLLLNEETESSTRSTSSLGSNKSRSSAGQGKRQ